MSSVNALGIAEGTEYQYEYTSDDQPSEAVVTAVADVAEKSPIPTADNEETADALSPLYEVINPDALNALLTTDDNQNGDCLVTFSYGDYTVTVQNGVVTVIPST